MQSIVVNQLLGDKKVRDLMVDKKRLVEVPYTASLAHTMNVLVANRVVALPVAAPPGHWIGAGGSMIMESDKRTGALRKHYIGMVTMLDILAHIAGDDDHDTKHGGDLLDLDVKMAVPVSSIIGHNVEGLSLWTLNPNTSLLDCMEIFSKGIHRAMVPVDGNTGEAIGVELVESAASYRMLTQMDVLRFLSEKAPEIQGILSKTVKEMEAINENVLAITDKTTVIEAIKCMKSAFLNAVPIVKSTQISDESHRQLFTGRGRKLVGTFSATDLRGCQLATLQTWLNQTALSFTDTVWGSPLFSTRDTTAEASPAREMVTCHPETPMGEVMEKVVSKHVHRVWVTDEHGLLVGLISLSDMIRVIRLSLLSHSAEETN